MQPKTNSGRIHFSDEQFVQVMLLKPQGQHSKETPPVQAPLSFQKEHTHGLEAHKMELRGQIQENGHALYHRLMLRPCLL